MIPAGLAGLEQQLLLWLLVAIRPGAALFAAPVFGAPGVPVQLRLIVALAIGVPAVGNVPNLITVEDLLSINGLLLLISETLLGLAIGFAVQIAFASALLGGEAISNAMGLGFASMNDPLGGQSSPAIGQFLSMLATALFLTLGGHLVLVRLVVESFHALPLGQAWLSFGAIKGLVKFGALIFAAGLAIALPLGFATLMVQIVMAFIARATPSLNLFAVGVPATLLGGVLMLGATTPIMGDALATAIRAGLEQAETLIEPNHG